MTLAKTFTPLDRKLATPAHSRPNRSGNGTPTTGHGTKSSDSAISQGEISFAGATSATCTTTSAASRPSTRASAASSNILDDEAGLAENTLVVYASDQGFYLGEHGWFDKRWIFEESLHSAVGHPLAGRRPGRRRERRPHESNLRFRRDVSRSGGGQPRPTDMQGAVLVPSSTDKRRPIGARASTITTMNSPVPIASGDTTES